MPVPDHPVVQQLVEATAVPILPDQAQVGPAGAQPYANFQAHLPHNIVGNNHPVAQLAEPAVVPLDFWNDSPLLRSLFGQQLGR